MFWSYATSAFRALKRDRFHAALNVFGLAVALAACFLIALYIRYEFSYDRYFSHPERLYRMETAVQPPGRDKYLSAYTPYALIDKMNADFSTEMEVTGFSPRIMTVAKDDTRPMAYQYDPAIADSISLRVRHGETAEALDEVQQVWTHVYPDQPMNYQFFEDVFAAANADDARQSQLFAVFTGLAIAVACLGLFGLASFVAARRTHEVAVRKVLGASTGRITGLLLWDFVKPVLAANIVAWPIAWMLMRQWLNGFAYRIDLSPAFFVGASLVALGIALLTVMARTIHAARTRPATALKYE